MNKIEIFDGNEAAAYIAYRTNEVIAIYPITPASTMGEHCDDWSSEHLENIWGNVPRVVEMQSEGGAAGAVHGSLLAGALTTTFTSSQGLLLMIPDMFKIAGELNPFVLHVAARAIATHALSIFGDHSDVMSVRSTGFAMLFATNVQESMDMALIAHAATLRSRLPFINAFDGFRTSHELNDISIISDDIIHKMMDENDIQDFRNRCLDPEKPVIKGTAQNPDVFFQNREACNQYYINTPEIVQETMDKLATFTGRSYKLFDIYGHAEPEKLIILMGSGSGATEETIDYLNAHDERTAVLRVRLFRPFSVSHFLKAVPASVKSIAVLDRTKEPGAIGEPLYQDIITAFAEEISEGKRTTMPRIIGGRYGLSSKEFTPAMVKSIFDELGKTSPKNHFTIGINDDLTHMSLSYDPSFTVEEMHEFRGLFFGLGADGTVSANKNSIKIIGEGTDNHVQGYFVYDSKKSGSMTISHLRFGKKKIKSTYLITSSTFIACHKFTFLQQYDILKTAVPGSVFLLNSPYGESDIWSQVPVNVQRQIIDKKIHFWAINASRVARDTGMGTRINGILQTCFFAISGILPREEAIAKIKEAIKKTYSDKGDAVIQKNFEAVDQAINNMFEVRHPGKTEGKELAEFSFPEEASDFAKTVLADIVKGLGEELPVSALPVDGTYPTATTKFEKRNIADMVPVWDKDICTQCNKCVVICPHAAIRAKVFEKTLLANAPANYPTLSPVGKEFNKDTESYALQVSVEDCTGCNLCVEYCPVESKTTAGHKAINMIERLPILEREKEAWEFFLSIPEIDRARMNLNTVKGTQFLQPLFEFSSACSGCGETPYLKLLTQLYGDRMIVANATGCSSIYGGSLPTTPWSKNKEGRGPAWANSLFEDNAEFGLGLRLAIDQKKAASFSLLEKLKETCPENLYDSLVNPDESNEAGIALHRKNIGELKDVLKSNDSPIAKNLLHLVDNMLTKSVWIVGGDGWAYDIGYGGLDHVMASGEKVNILVLDTEVYSNTGGQTSKSTPTGAIARFSASGKKAGKKNLGFMAMNYKTVYVAQIALGANDTQTLRAMREAEAYPGPSLIIAYSPCIAHGFDMSKGAEQQQNAVKSGYWPLFRYNPMLPEGKRFTLDSKEATIPLEDFIYKEGRYTSLVRQDKVLAAELLIEAQRQVTERWGTLKSFINI